MSLFTFVSVEFFQKPKEYISDIVSGIIPIVFISAIFYSILFGLSRYLFGDFIGLPLKYYLLIPFVSFLYNIKAIILVLFRNNAKALSFGILNIAATILYISFAIYFVVIQKENWQGRANAEIISAFIVSAVSLFVLIKMKYLSFTINKSVIKENFKFALPLIPSLFALTVITLADRFFIKEMMGEAELGLYSIGMRLGMIIAFILYSFEQIALPFIYEKLSKEEEQYKLHLVKFTILYFAMVLVVVVLVTIGSYILLELNFLPAKYLDAKKYIFWIALAYGFFGLSKILSPYIDFYKQTKFLMYAAIIGCVFNLVANYILILHFGTIGAAYSKVLTFFLIFLLYFFFSNKLSPMPWFKAKSYNFRKKELFELFESS